MLSRQLSEIYILSWNASTSAMGYSALKNITMQFRVGWKRVSYHARTSGRSWCGIFLLSQVEFLFLQRFAGLLEAECYNQSVCHNSGWYMRVSYVHAEFQAWGWWEIFRDLDLTEFFKWMNELLGGSDILVLIPATERFILPHSGCFSKLKSLPSIPLCD